MLLRKERHHRRQKERKARTRPVNPALRMETTRGMRAETEAALKERKVLERKAVPKELEALKAPEMQAVLKKQEAPAKEAALPQPAPMKTTARQRAVILEAMRLRLKAAVRIMSLSLKMSWNHLQTAALPQ